MPPVLRFAPSPNGRLHLGHAYSALLNAELAKRLNGRFLLRLEDIDTTRCTTTLKTACVEDLAWLGLSWGAPVRVQSEHFPDYAAAAKTLQSHELIYPCFCTRKQVNHESGASDPDGAPIYAGTCKQLSEVEAQSRIAAGEPHAWRLHMERAMKTAHELSYRRFMLPDFAEEQCPAHPEKWGDVIVVRKDTPTSYHLSVVVDDALQGITQVVRGKDLEASTCVHVLLQTLLGLPTPIYHHHELFQDGAGQKLSKSLGSESLDDLRKRGISPEEIMAILGSWQ